MIRSTVQPLPNDVMETEEERPRGHQADAAGPGSPASRPRVNGLPARLADLDNPKTRGLENNCAWRQLRLQPTWDNSVSLPVYRMDLGQMGECVMSGERERDHLRRCRVCANPAATIEWGIQPHVDRRAIAVTHEAIADLVGRPGATGMLVPAVLQYRGNNQLEHVSYTSRSLHDRYSLQVALANSEAPDYASAFYDVAAPDGGVGSRLWSAEKGNTYLHGPTLEDVEWHDCFFCSTYVYASWKCSPRVGYTVVTRGTWVGIAVEHAAVRRLLQVPDATGMPKAVTPTSYEPASIHQLNDLKTALANSGAPITDRTMGVRPVLYDSHTCLWVRGSRL